MKIFMINIAIPGFYELKEINLAFLELKKEYPEMFYNDINISAIYGNPQHCVWDGGRMFFSEHYSTLEQIKDLIYLYNDVYDIPIRYIFTNSMLKEEDYYDRFCNLLLSLGNNYYKKNEVVIYDNNLLSFIKERYNNYKYISSTTKCLTNKIDIINELENKNYNLVCLDYNINNNFNFLETLTNQQKQKIEILLNPICDLMCPYRKEHYKLNSIYNLNYTSTSYSMEECHIQNKNYNEKINFINLETIKNKYYPIGINNFKIEGRTWKNNYNDIINIYCDFFIKEEYKEKYFKKIFEKLKFL